MGDGLGEGPGELSARAEEQMKHLLDGTAVGGGEALALQDDDGK